MVQMFQEFTRVFSFFLSAWEAFVPMAYSEQGILANNKTNSFALKFYLQIDLLIIRKSWEFQRKRTYFSRDIQFQKYSHLSSSRQFLDRWEECSFQAKNVVRDENDFSFLSVYILLSEIYIYTSRYRFHTITT